MQAVIGRLQLEKLDDWVRRRRQHAALLGERLGRLSAIRVPAVPDDVYHSRYKFYVSVRPEILRPGWTRDRILTAITERGAPCFAGSCSAIYRERAFARTGWAPANPLP